MWNPFKRKHLVPVDECINAIIASIKKENCVSLSLWVWLEEKHGVKRKWDWRDHKNYLVFDNEYNYTMFLIKL